MSLHDPELREIVAAPDGFAVACVIPVGRARAAGRRLSRRPVEAFARLDPFDGEPLTDPAGC